MSLYELGFVRIPQQEKIDKAKALFFQLFPLIEGKKRVDGEALKDARTAYNKWVAEEKVAYFSSEEGKRRMEAAVLQDKREAIANESIRESNRLLKEDLKADLKRMEDELGQDLVISRRTWKQNQFSEQEAKEEFTAAVELYELDASWSYILSTNRYTISLRKEMEFKEIIRGSFETHVQREYRNFPFSGPKFPRYREVSHQTVSGDGRRDDETVYVLSEDY